MPSFLSKVFGRKKDDKESPRRVEDTELLDGKFEAVSPSATKFPEVANERQSRDKDSPFNVFRPKSRPSSPEPKDKRAELPHLSLNLPGLKNEEASRELGVVFEADPESQILSEEAIGSRRLNPLETLILVRACSEVIIARGLETLGVMHPHWHSASPEEQRKLISLFLKSLGPRTSISTLSPTPTAIATAFDSEISSTQSPYDVAAVLRWGLRHLRLEGTSFGKEDTWYKTFFDAERSAGYPPNGYSTTLAPLLPTTHLELLTATLEVFSSLAAHAEANGISGSKLSKFFGLWLLTIEHAQEDDDWSTFYARWERTGRMLEHMFLSRIRDDATESRMPTRLLELIQRYPYQTDPNADLLARPRFSTIQYDALFVRIETELSATTDQPSHHPLRIISEAFKAEASPDAGEPTALWESIRKAGANGGSSSSSEYPGLSHIFADETLRFFSLVPVETSSSAIGSPSFNLYTQPSRHQSSSSGDKNATPAAAATVVATSSILLRHSKTPTSPVTSSNLNSPIGPDWITFSTSGFTDDSAEQPPLASTLMEKEKDMEVTIPRPSSPRLSLFSNGRKSFDRPRTPAKAEDPKHFPPPAPTPTPVKTVSKSTRVSLIQLDEAFIDFWSDALLDPISSSWPVFIICRLKNTGTEVQGKRIEWLVLEQAFKRPPLPLPEASTSSHSHSYESPRHTRPSSPNSNKSDGGFTFGSVFKKFGFFTSPGKVTSPLREDKEGTKKGKGKGKVVSLKVGEMGEILREENRDKNKGKEKKEKKDEVVRVRVPSPKPKKSVEVSRKSVDVTVKKSLDEASRTNAIVAGSLAAGAAAVVGGAAVAVAVGASEEPQVVKAEELVPAPAPAAEPTTNSVPVESVASVVPEEVPVPALVKVTPFAETAIGSAAVQNGEAPSTAAEPKVFSEDGVLQSETPGRPPVEVSEPKAAQPAAEEAQATEPEIVSAAKEVKPTGPNVEPAMEKKVLESEVVSAVEEAKTPELEVAPVIEEAKIPELKAVPAVEEAKAIEPVVEAKVSQPEAVPYVAEDKVSEHEAMSIVEEAKTPEPEVVPIVEDVRASEFGVGSTVEEAKAAEPEAEPLIEETKVPEPKAAAVYEVKPTEPEVASIVEEAKVPEPEVAPVVEGTQTHEFEVAPVVKPTEPEVVPIIDEAKVSEPEVVQTVEETQAQEPEVAPVVNEVKVTELEVAPIIEEAEVPELEVVQTVNEIKVVEPEAKPVIEEVKVSEPEAIPTVEEAKVLEPEVTPAVEEIKAHEPGVAPVVDEIEHTEPEVAPAIDEINIPEPVMKETVTETDVTPVVEEAKISEPEPAPSHEETGAAMPVIEATIPVVLAADAAIPETQIEVANKTTPKDFSDEPREVDEADTTLKEYPAEPIVEFTIPKSEQVIAQEPQAIIEQIAEPAAEALQPAVEEKFESVVDETHEPTEDTVTGKASELLAADVTEPVIEVIAEPAVQPIVEETIELATEPVVEDQSAVAEVAQEAAASAVEEAVEPVVIEEIAQPLVTEAHQPVVEETVEPQVVVEESQGPVEAALPVVEQEAITKEPVPEPVLDKNAPPSAMISKDDVSKPVVEGITATEEAQTTVSAEKYVEDALVTEGGLASVEAVVIKEEASPRMQDAKTSVEERSAAVPAIEEQSTPVVKSIAEEPVKAVVEEEIPPVAKEIGEVATPTVTEVVAPTPEEITEEVAPIIKKPVDPLSALEEATPEPVERILVAEEESVSIEPKVVEEKIPIEAVDEVIETSQEELGVEDTVASKPKPVLPIVEAPFELTVEPVMKEAPEPFIGEQVTAIEEHVAAVVEGTPVVEPAVEDKQIDTPAVEKAVVTESTSVAEDVTESPASIKEEVTLVKDSTPAVEKPETEPSVSIEAEPVPIALDQSAGETPAVGSDSVGTKEVTPIMETPASSTAEPESVVGPTEATSVPSREVVVPNAEGLTVSETDHKPEIKEPTPVEPVPVAAEVPEENDVLVSSAGAVPGPEELAPAIEEHRPTTVESEVEAEVLASPARAEPIPIAAEQSAGESTDVVESEDVHIPTEVQPVAVDSTSSTPEPETSAFTERIIAAIVDPIPSAAAEPESAVEVPATSEAEPAPIAADHATEDSIDIAKSKEETPVPTETAPIVEETASSAAAETAPIAVDQPAKSIDVVEHKEILARTEEASPIIESTLSSAEPEAKVVVTEFELPLTTADQPIVEEPQHEVKPAPIEVQPTSANTDKVSEESTVTANPIDETPASVSEATPIEEPVPASVVEPESVPGTPSPIGAESTPLVVEQHVESTADPTEKVADPSETPVLTAVAHVEEPTPSAAAQVEPEPEVLASIEAESTSTTADEPAEKSPDIINPAEEVSVPAEEQFIAPVVEEPAHSTVIESEPKPEASASSKVDPTPIATDQPAESTTVADSTEKALVLSEEAAHVQEPASSAESESKPEVSAPVEAKPALTAEHESNEESTPATHAAEETPAPTTKEVTVPIIQEPVAEEPKSSTGEPEPQAEASVHTDIEPTPTAEENARIIDSKEEIPAALIVEESAPAVEESAPAVEESAPAVEESAPAVEESAPAAEESAPAVEESAPAVEESAPAIKELAHTVEESAPAVEESALTVEESAPAVEEPEPMATTHETEPEQARALAQVESALATTDVDEPIEEKPAVLETTKEASAHMPEEVAVPAIEEPKSSAEPETVAPVEVESESAPAADQPLEKSSTPVKPTHEAHAPAIKEVPLPVVEEAKPLVVEAEPVVKTPALVGVEPVSAAVEEPVEKSTPIVEHVPVAEVPVEEVPVVKEMVPVDAMIVEEKPAEIGIVPVIEDTTKPSGPVDETISEISEVTWKNDIAENGNGHSTAVKEEELAKVAVSADSHHDNNATSPAEE